MLRALEGKKNCFWRLHKPIPFQYGRADCVRDEKKATTKFPFAATEHENHANPFGQGDWVLKELKRDFGVFLASLAPIQWCILFILCRYECSPDHCHDGSSRDLYSRSQQDHWRPLQVGIIHKLFSTVSDGLELRSYPTCTSKPWEADLSTTLAWDLPSSHSGERRVSYWVDLNFICFFFPLICPCILCPAPGDKFGRPLNRDIQGDFTLHTNNW